MLLTTAKNAMTVSRHECLWQLFNVYLQREKIDMRHKKYYIQMSPFRLASFEDVKYLENFNSTCPANFSYTILPELSVCWLIRDVL